MSRHTAKFVSGNNQLIYNPDARSAHIRTLAKHQVRDKLKLQTYHWHTQCKGFGGIKKPISDESVKKDKPIFNAEDVFCHKNYFI